MIVFVILLFIIILYIINNKYNLLLNFTHNTINDILYQQYQQPISTIPYEIPVFTNINNNNNFNIGILLAAGLSSRFNNSKPKQLYIINNKHIISYSIDVMMKTLDKLIIVTNSICYKKIKRIVKNKSIIILKNDINCRLESIGIGLNYINKHYNYCSNVLIHDGARPYITALMIDNLLLSNKNYLYSQYYLKLVNGLIKIKPTYEFVNRDEFIEACTPICINYKLCYFIFMNYIEKSKRVTSEFIPIMKLLNLDYNFIEGKYKFLRKITTRDDIF